MSAFSPYNSIIKSAPGSQESLTSPSIITTTSRMVDSSNTSQTTIDTDMASPTSQQFSENASSSAENPTENYKITQRLQTPEDQLEKSDDWNDKIGSTTPLAGHKRMASGQIKDINFNQHTSGENAPRDNMKRAGSVGSTMSKASEAAASLKEKLTYAMTKVQHGWQHHNIDQVEQLVAAARSPKSPAKNPSQDTTSPRAAYLPRRALINHLPGRIINDDEETTSLNVTSDKPNLAPAFDVQSPSPRRTKHVRARSQINGSSPVRKQATTPTTPRHSQTNTAQAEQEAMTALLLMGSPKSKGRSNSQQIHPQHIIPQSPLRKTNNTSVRRDVILSDKGFDSDDDDVMYDEREYDRETTRRRGELLSQIEAEI